MSIAYIALGANLDNPAAQVKTAIESLNHLPETRLCKASSLYRSTPVGYADQPDFINAVAEIDTQLSAEALLTHLLTVEEQFGRIRSFRNAPRVLDLDLLLYDDLTVDTPQLVLPHPRMTERAFVMIPLEEIAPDLIIARHGPVKILCQRFVPETGLARLS